VITFRILEEPAEEPEPERAVSEHPNRMAKDKFPLLLDELERTYTDPPWREKIDKLIQEAGNEPAVFLEKINLLSLEIHGQLLKNWGFDQTSAGVEEMRQAIENAVSSDPALKERAEKVAKELYGSAELGMYEATQALEAMKGTRRSIWN